MGDGGRNEQHGKAISGSAPGHLPERIEFPRAMLRDHLADLDQVCSFVETLDNPEIGELLDGVLTSLHDRVFGHLPDGEPGEEAAA